ncbi:MAG: protein tyrosine phosphatase [Hymenobacteraceae bacterium]|nr:protein tyrosine phosphatase [Hymenobacteraceae bacterium]
MKLLFICSRNKQRSLTAERVFDGFDGHQARSAGTEPGARIRVAAGHLGWTDVIFVMEKRHQQRLQDKFADALAGKHLVVLYIPDDFAVMEETLIHRLHEPVRPHVPAA